MSNAIFAGEGGRYVKYCNADTTYSYEYVVGTSVKELTGRELNKDNN